MRTESGSPTSEPTMTCHSWHQATPQSCQRWTPWSANSSVLRVRYASIELGLESRRQLVLACLTQPSTGAQHPAAPTLRARDTAAIRLLAAQPLILLSECCVCSPQCGDKKSVSRQQLQAVLQATRAIAERIVHEPTFALDPLTIKRAITLLRLIAQQQQILDALIDDCRCALCNSAARPAFAGQ